MSMIGPREPSYEAMVGLKASIPEAERCEECEGMGWIQVGCTMTRGIYWPCLNCLETGKKSETIAEIKKRIDEKKS